MDKIKPYLKFPSKAPLAWFVYVLLEGFIQRLSWILNYKVGGFFVSWLFLPFIFIISLCSLVQVIVNIKRVFTKEEKVTFKKILITILLIFLLFAIVNPVSNWVELAVSNKLNESLGITRPSSVPLPK